MNTFEQLWQSLSLDFKLFFITVLYTSTEESCTFHTLISITPSGKYLPVKCKQENIEPDNIHFMCVVMFCGNEIACTGLNCRARYLLFMSLANMTPGYIEITIHCHSHHSSILTQPASKTQKNQPNERYKPNVMLKSYKKKSNDKLLVV